jgi:hypothetical protein
VSSESNSESHTVASRNPCARRYPVSCGHCPNHTFCHADDDSYTYIDSYTRSHPNSDPCYANTHPNAHPDPNTYSNSHTCPDPNSHTSSPYSKSCCHPNTYTYSDACSDTNRHSYHGFNGNSK